MLPEPVQNFVIILGALLVAFTALTLVIAALAVSFGVLNISLLPAGADQWNFQHDPGCDQHGFRSGRLDPFLSAFLRHG